MWPPCRQEQQTPDTCPHGSFVRGPSACRATSPSCSLTRPPDPRPPPLTCTFTHPCPITHRVPHHVYLSHGLGHLFIRGCTIRQQHLMHHVPDTLSTLRMLRLIPRVYLPAAGKSPGSPSRSPTAHGPLVVSASPHGSASPIAHQLHGVPIVVPGATGPVFAIPLRRSRSPRSPLSGGRTKGALGCRFVFEKNPVHHPRFSHVMPVDLLGSRVWGELMRYLGRWWPPCVA